MMENTPSDLQEISLRASQKRHDYITYDFTPKKNDALKTFFDLAQEYNTVEDLYRICVVILKEYFQVESRLYLNDSPGGKDRLVCDSVNGLYQDSPPAPSYVEVGSGDDEKRSCFLVPLYTKVAGESSETTVHESLRKIGVLEVFPLESLTNSDKFFLEKYGNRIAYNLQNKLLAQENVRHLKFINNLVNDIEHNVIIPNMYFRHLYKQLAKGIAQVDQLLSMIKDSDASEAAQDDSCRQKVANSVQRIQKNLHTSFEDIDKHHKNYTLFLESLFRRDHFEQGCFVLRKKILNVEREIIKPQFEHYKSRFEARNIAQLIPVDFKEGSYSINADLGLLSQVYANLFSNAVKYTTTIIDESGNPKKAVAYGHMVLDDYYGPGKPAIKLNVFTTGAHLSPREVEHIFTDGFQGRNKTGSHSCGHGLSFVKYVIELHGGVVGYEPTKEGNNFYFILPMSDAPSATPK